MTDDETQIRRILDDMAAGYRAKDPERIVARFAPDIVKFDLAPPLFSRAGDLVDIGGGRSVDMTTGEGVGTWLAGFGDVPFDYVTRDVEVTVGDVVAYARLLARMGTGGMFEMWFRLTVGFQKRDGIWQITHTHASTPFYMDETRKAALDLQP